MKLEGSKLAVIGGAGLIGSHTVDELLTHDIKEVVIFDNFARGSEENLAMQLKTHVSEFTKQEAIFCKLTYCIRLWPM